MGGGAVGGKDGGLKNEKENILGQFIGHSGLKTG